MQIAKIAQSLKEVTADTPAIASLLTSLGHGTRISPSAELPYGLIAIDEIERVFNSSGVALVTYEATLTVYVKELVETAGNILELFHRYWDRLNSLDALDSEIAKLVLIEPTPAPTEIGEADREDLGKDVIVGITSWTIVLSEHQPELEE